MNFRILPLVLCAFLLPGCLIVSKISYHISVGEDRSGSAVVTFHDIRSDAIGNKEFEEDRKNLFEYILKSDEFVNSLQLEGKFIKSRDLKISEGKLTGVAKYDFNDVEKIEGIRHQDGLYYLTLQSDDKVLSTNGEMVSTGDYKRIIWRDSATELLFEIESGQVQQKTRDLTPYLNKAK